MVADIFETTGLVLHVLLPKYRYRRMLSVGLIAINGW